MTTHLSTETPTARKEHVCDWCGEKILRGEQYSRWNGIFEGDFQSNPLHTECDKAAQVYFHDIASIGDGYEPCSFKRGSTDDR